MWRKRCLLTLTLCIVGALFYGCGSMPVQVGDSSAKTVATGSAGGGHEPECERLPGAL